MQESKTKKLFKDFLRKLLEYVGWTVFIALMASGAILIAMMFGRLVKKTENFPPDPALANTHLRVVNETQDSVLMYLTLSGYAYPQDTLFVQNVNSIFGCTQTGLNGQVWIHAGDSVSYTSIKYFSGNISFGVAPMNCPDSTWKTGMNLFEFNLNEPQESLDISCMAGVNCIMKVDLLGGPAWPASIYADPRVLQNDSMYKNTGRVGVYPYGDCNCTDSSGKQQCQTPSETPNTNPICNPTRAKGDRGGVVRVAFKGYTNWQILK